MCWILAGKILLKCHVSYVGNITGDVHQFPKENRTLLPQRKFRGWHATQESCPRSTCWWELWLRGLRRRRGHHVNQGRFRHGKTNTSRRATCYAVVSTGLAPDYPGLRVREKPLLYQTRVRREASRNEDYSMPEGGLVPVSSKQNEEKAVHWWFVSRVYISAVFDSLPHSTILYISWYKRKI